MQWTGSAVNHFLTPPTPHSTMSSVPLASESRSFEEEGGVVVLTPPLLSHGRAPIVATPPAPPPPPPLPVGTPAERKRVRGFFWKPIPEGRVKQSDGQNLWTLGHGRGPVVRIDTRAVEELFGQQEDTGKTVGGGRPSGKDLRQQITILNSKRSLNISIFLKRFKKSSECVLDGVLRGHTGVFSVEFLQELQKLLPQEDEVKNLQMFSGNPKHLPPPDAFMFRLIRVPRYELRLEALLLQEEVLPSLAVMTRDIAVALTAVHELLNCEELHNVLHLVLQAGNIMNAGGSAGNAVGFSLSSLLSLADTKANRPGMNLLHFVALEAQKKDLLMFPEKLQHIQQAARVCVDSIHEEFHCLTRRVDHLEQHIRTDDELLTQLRSFLKSAAEALEDLRIRTEELQRDGDALIDFFCEDKDIFKLDECFRIFQNFCSKFKKAVQENVERGMWEESRRKRLKESEDKRHSWAGHEHVGGAFGLRSNSEADVEAALKREGLLELLKTSSDSSPLRFGSVRRSRKPKKMTFDPCQADLLPPIHSLSIADDSLVTEEPEIQNKSLSTEESQNNDQAQVTPDMTFDPSQINLEVKSEVMSDDHKVRKDVKRTSEALKSSSGATQSIQTSSKRPVGSSSSKPSSSSSSSSSSSCLRKVVPLRMQISALSSSKRTPAARPAPQEKMCRRSPRTSALDSTLKPPGFARNTVASTTRTTTAPGNQPTGKPSLAAPPPAGRPRKSSSALSENSPVIRGSRDKTVKPVWK